MALEIERRFLVRADGWRSHRRRASRLEQGYLCAQATGATVRVRSSSSLDEPAAGFGESLAWLTIKAAAEALPGPCLSRLEFEYPIPAADAAALLALSRSRLVKIRHELDLPGGDWVVDVFEADNAPLVLAEVEIDSPQRQLAIPSWCGREIGAAEGLSNAELAARPLACWSEEERRQLLG
jgi:adenylate cyclase